MKTILFIEDLYDDYHEFNRIFTLNAINVYPLAQNINNQIELNNFLGKNLTITDYTKKETDFFLNFKNKIFQYINENELYKVLSLIVLDINLTSNSEEKLGLDFLSSFRLEFIASNPNYKDWNKIIPVIALSIYNKSKYENEFISYPGYLLDFYNKDNVRAKNEGIIKSINNFHEQTQAIMPLFFDREVKELIININNGINEQKISLDEINQISRLILFSEIAQLPIEKRNAFIENFCLELIKYTKENDNFMFDIEEKEKNLKTKISNLMNSNNIQIINFISSLTTILTGIIKPDKVLQTIEFIIKLISNNS